MKPLRILHIVGTMDYGGVETLLMTIYRQIDRNKLQFDFLCHNSIDCKFSEEIRQLGGRMYMVNGPRHVGMRGYQRELYQFFHTHPEYTVIHCHKSDNNGLILKPAKRVGVAHRISHCHIANCHYSFPMSVLMAYSRWLNNHCLTDRFACSADAGDYLFGKGSKYTILPNAINIDRFRFSLDKRQEYRCLLGIKDSTLLIGHVGRFAEQKNHKFLIDTFAAVHESQPDSKLVLLGAGELEQQLHAQVESLCLQDAVIFAGLHADLSGYYCAMDVFLFPSLFEGLGIVAVEAQCAGLPVVASAEVPKEAKTIERMTFLPLDVSVQTWAETVCSMASANTDSREACADEVAKSMFNIETMAAYLQNYYLKL